MGKDDLRKAETAFPVTRFPLQRPALRHDLPVPHDRRAERHDHGLDAPRAEDGRHLVRLSAQRVLPHSVVGPFQHPRLPEDVAHGPGGGHIGLTGLRGGGERAPVGHHADQVVDEDVRPLVDGRREVGGIRKDGRDGRAVVVETHHAPRAVPAVRRVAQEHEVDAAVGNE